MPAPGTTDEFLDLVQKSGVADWPKLSAYVDGLRAAGTLPDQPTRLGTLLVRDAQLTFFQAEQILQGKWKRFSIGKYKVLERLGSGGMGQVFLCEHKLMRRRVAVKVLPTAKAADAASLDRFYREARAVAALDHPNLVRAYDIDHDEGLHFLVMEWVDGVNLQDLVKVAGPLPIARACHYVYGAAVGLQYASTMGLIHRDIKPANVLVDRSGVVKILDMGLARFFHDEDDSLTRKYDETVLGTADYLAPEQAVDSHTVDLRADLYSLGGTFYFLLTGLPPFPEGTVAQKLLWHQTREPKPVRVIRPDVPEDVAAVVERMMKKKPEDRYQTPAELMAALQEFVQTPIPPPSEAELPKLSPAAAGGSAGRNASGVLLAGGSPLTSSSAGIPILTAPGGSSRKAAPAAPDPDPAQTMQTRHPTPQPMPGLSAEAPPAVVAVPAAVAETPAPDAGVGVWGSLGAEPTNSGQDAPTVRRTERAKPASRRAAPAGKPTTAADPAAAAKKRKLLIYAGAGVGGLVLLIGVTLAVVNMFGGGSAKTTGDGSGQQAVAPPGAKKLYVGKAGGPDGAAGYKRIADALNKAKPGDTLVLTDDRYEENLNVPAKLQNLTIEGGAAGKPPVWTIRPESSQPASVVNLPGLAGFTLRNVVLDGGGKAKAGLAVSGSAAGLTVEDVTVRGATETGVLLFGAVGTADKPMTFVRVRVQAAGQAGYTIGGQGGRPAGHLRITDGRVEGPAAAGFLIDGPVDALEIKHCRVFNVSVGVSVAGEFGAADPLKLTVVGNTFHTLKDAGLKATAVPAKADVTVRQNYFAKTAVLGVAPGGKWAGLKASDNARDAGSKDGSVPLKAAEVPNDRIPPPKPDDDDGRFLRYGKDSPLNAVGPAKLPAGVPPQ